MEVEFLRGKTKRYSKIITEGIEGHLKEIYLLPADLSLIKFHLRGCGTEDLESHLENDLLLSSTQNSVTPRAVSHDFQGSSQ